MSGRTEPRELATAREGLSWRRRRSAIRAVNRGAQVPDVASAALAVALAREAVRRDRSRSDARLFSAGAFSVASFVILLISIADEGLSVGTVVLGVLALSSIPSVLHMCGRTRRWQRAEAFNRELLADHGRPFTDDEVRVRCARPTLSQIVPDTVIQWVIADLGYGAIDRATSDRSLNLNSIVRHGALFATIMTAIALVRAVRRNWGRRGDEQTAARLEDSA